MISLSWIQIGIWIRIRIRSKRIHITAYDIQVWKTHLLPGRVTEKVPCQNEPEIFGPSSPKKNSLGQKKKQEQTAHTTASNRDADRQIESNKKENIGDIMQSLCFHTKSTKNAKKCKACRLSVRTFK